MKDFDDRTKLGKAIVAIKALFKISKTIKSIKEMNLESIRKIWVLIGTLLATLGASWMPQIIVDLFGEMGTDLVFGLIGSVFALFQFVKSRTGEEEAELNAQLSGANKAPAPLKAEDSKVAYLLNPFKSAA